MSDTQEKKSKGRSITLTISEQKYMELLIKIRHENLNWKRFFGFLIKGFVEDDSRIMEYIDLQMMDIRAKSRTKVLHKEREATQQTKDIFGLDEEEIQDIYDILEEEIEP